MPIFEYRCGGCRKTFERIVLGPSGAAKAVVCPACGAGKPERLVSRFATAAKAGAGDSGGDFGSDGTDFGPEGPGFGDDAFGGGGGLGGPAGGEEDEYGGGDEETDEGLGSEDGEDDD